MYWISTRTYIPDSIIPIKKKKNKCIGIKYRIPQNKCIGIKYCIPQNKCIRIKYRIPQNKCIGIKYCIPQNKCIGIKYRIPQKKKNSCIGFQQEHMYQVLYIPWILRINLFKPTNPKDELV
jgi:cation transport regulator ChaC